ncbi:cytochrome d ubiquinol oxidase subunit II [Methylomonas sp. MgM2]
MPFELESLRLIWWGILGAVMIVFAMSEGLSLGITLLLPILGKSEHERRYLIKQAAPISLANMAWLIVLMAIMFAAWPIAYAVSLSSFYPVLLLMLLAMLFRPLALYFPETVGSNQSRLYVNKAIGISGLIPASLFGLLAGNLLKGIPFHLESDMQIRFLGDFRGLFNLFAVLIALTSIALFAMHGAVFLQSRTRGELQQNAKGMAIRAGVLFLVLFALSGLWITRLEGYHISSELSPNDASNPLAKFVKRGEGLWLDNYEHLPVLWVIPAFAFIGAAATIWFARAHKSYRAMLASSLTVCMVVLTFGISMFPFLLPSNISLNSSLTVWDSSAGGLSLQVLLWVAVFALPLLAVCTRWLYALFSDQHQSNFSETSDAETSGEPGAEMTD